MCNLNKKYGDAIPNACFTHWQCCVFGDYSEAENNLNGWAEAFEFAQHRGVDLQQILERWIADVVQ